MTSRALAMFCGVAALGALACGKAYDAAPPDADAGDGAAPDDASRADSAAPSPGHPDAAVDGAATLAIDASLLRKDLPGTRFTVDPTFFYYDQSKTNAVGQVTSGVARVRLDGQGAEEFVATTGGFIDALLRFGPHLYVASGQLEQVATASFSSPTTVLLPSIWRFGLGVAGTHLYVLDRATNQGDLRRTTPAGVPSPTSRARSRPPASSCRAASHPPERVRWSRSSTTSAAPTS